MSSKGSCNCELDIDQCTCSGDTAPLENYYEVLFLNNDCHLYDIEKAFKTLAKKYNENDETKTHIKDCQFAKMKAAFEVLSNPLKRLIYDNFGVEGLKTPIPEPYGWAENFIHQEEEEIDDLPAEKETLDECQKPRNKLSKVENIMKDLYLTLEELLYGGLKKISVIKRVLTDDCNCEKMYEQKIVSVHIKPGLPTNSRIVFVEEGNEAPCKIAGDIILTTRDKPHKIFHRDGSNLLMSVNVNIQESLLGKNISIDTIDKRKIRVNITSIITPDYKKVVSGEGLPIFTNPNERGDLIISFQIAFPLYLSVPVKSEIERIFTGASKNIAKSDNEYIHRSILDEKMRKMGDHSDL